MSNFSIYFKNYRKIIFSVVLLSIISGIFLPITSGVQTAVAAKEKIQKVELVNVPNKANECGLFHLLNCGAWLIAKIIVGLSRFLDSIITEIATWSQGLYLTVMTNMIKENLWAITKLEASPGVPTIAGAAFLTSWEIVKSWANMLIVLGFIGVALAWILSLDQYKRLLIPLLIVALLVNFSVVFVGFIIDVSNIIIKSLTFGAEKQATLVGAINNAWNVTVADLPTDTLDDAVTFAGANAIFGLIYLSLSVTLFYLTIIFIQRYVILAILFILSPLAFVFYAFPLQQSKELFGKWWHSFIKWCFIGLGGAFFIKLSVDVLGLLNPGSIENLTQRVFYILIALAFMAIGLRITMKTSNSVANFVIGTAKTVGLAVATGGASLLGKTTGLLGINDTLKSIKERTGAKVSDMYARTTDYLGLTKGRANELKRGRFNVSAGEKRISNLTPEEVRKTALTYKRSMTNEEIENRLAAIKNLQKTGEFSEFDKPRKERLMDFVIGHTSEPDKIEKEKEFVQASPDLAERATMAKAELIRRGKATTDSEAEGILRRDAYATMRVENLSDKSDQDIIKKAREVDAAGNITSEAAKHLEEAIRRGILDIVGTFNETARLLENAKDRLGSNALRSAAQEDPRYNRYDKQMVDAELAEMRQTNPAATINEAQQRVVEKGYQRSDPSRLTKDALRSLDFLKNARSKPLAKALEERMTSGKISALKDFVNSNRATIAAEVSALQAAGNISEAAELVNVVAAIDAA